MSQRHKQQKTLQKAICQSTYWISNRKVKVRISQGKAILGIYL